MTDDLARLWDRHRIRACVLAAARGADRLDGELVRSSFWPDASVRYGGGEEWSVSEFFAAWREAADACVATEHYLLNDRLEIEGDTAFSESYFIAVFVLHVGAGDRALLPFAGAIASGETAFQGGRFVDRLERRDGEWRIVRRRVVGDWYATADGTQTTARRQAIARSPGGDRALRTRDDLSYRSPRSNAPTEPLAEPLAELLAHEAIRDCMFRYARGVDRLDRDLLASVFVDVDQEREFVDEIFARRETRPTQTHYVTNLCVNLNSSANAAHAEAYFIAVHREVGTGNEITLVGGRFVLELTRPAGEWRIATRTTIGEWHAVGDGSHVDAFLEATGNKSKRTRDDASYDPLVTVAVSQTLEDLAAREGVRDCLARYARGCDRLDKELIASSFFEVAPQFLDYILGQAETRPVQNHCWTNLRIQLAGDDAFIEAYYISVHGYVDGASSGFIEGTTSEADINLIGGRYVRRFRKVGPGRWGLENLSSSKQYPPPSGGLGDWHAMVDGSRRAAYLRATGNLVRRGSREDPSYLRE